MSPRSLVLPALLSLALLAACGEKKGSAPAPGDSGRATAPATPAPEQKPAPAAAKLEKLPFDKSALPGKCSYTGKVKDGAHWRDANGENWLVVSEQLSPTAEGKKQELFGYLWTVKGDSVQQLWKIQDMAENMCDEGKGLASDIMVDDVDNDGVAENAFVYNVQGNCDVSPTEYKLMFHSGQTKHAIRGASSSNPGGGYDTKRATNADFGNAPDSWKKWAMALWDRTVK